MFKETIILLFPLGLMTMMDASTDQTPVQDASSREIRDAQGPRVLPVDSPPASADVLRQYANDRQNSRLGVKPPPGQLKPIWKSDLEAGIRPLFLLTGGGRIVLQAEFQWLLFGEEGTLLARERLGAGSILVDPENKVFYLPSPSGMIAAYDLTSGGVRFITDAFLGREFRRAFLKRDGNMLLIVSIEFIGQPHGGPGPRLSVVEVQDLGSTSSVDENHFLLSATARGEKRFDTVQLLTALDGKSLVVATENSISILDQTLATTAQLHGKFTPVVMSLDDEGRIYLVVSSEGRRQFWVVDSDGRRTISCEVPPGIRDMALPPVIGYDHTVYLVSSTRVAAIDARGRTMWENPLTGRLGGAVVTPDNRLLVAAGNVLCSYDAAGERTVLQYFEGEELATAPVVTKNGKVLVATGTKLYCLDVAH